MTQVSGESKKEDARAAAEDREVLGSLRESHGLLLRANTRKTRPHVLTVTRRTVRKNKYIDYMGEYHLELLIKLGCLPVMIPVVEGTEACLTHYMQPMHGLLLVEGEDVGLEHYKTEPANHKYIEKTHPLKDVIEIALLKQAQKLGVPILSICRGSQLLNVVNGGTLFGDVQKEKKSHRTHQSDQHYDSYRHPLTIVPKTPLHQWYGLNDIKVNSYHHQGVRKLASRFEPMGYADDGLIEAFFDPKEPFVVGLQFHPERMLSEYKGNLKLWQAFGRAIHQYARRRPSR